MDIKREVEIQNNIVVNTKEALELPKPKPARSGLCKKLLVGFSVVLTVLFVVYIGLMNKFQQRTYYVRNFPTFGFGRCEPHLYYRSLQNFEFDPKEFDSFRFYSYHDQKGSSVKFAKHNDSSNVKILYNIHASDQYTLDNIKTYSNQNYGYEFRVDAPYSSFFQRHCIKIQLTVSFPEGLEHFRDMFIGGTFSHLNVTSDLETKFDSLYLNSQDGMFIDSVKANHLSASSAGIIHVTNSQLNGGYLSSWNGAVIVKGIKKFESKFGGNSTHYYGNSLEVVGKCFTLVKDAHISRVNVRSDTSVIKNVKAESINVQAKKSVRVIDSTINYLDVNTFGEVSATVSESNQVSVYSKQGSTHLTVKSFGILNATQHHGYQSRYKSYGNSTYKHRFYSGYRPSVHRNYYSFEVLSLDGNASIKLPSEYEGQFEAIARIGLTSVNSTSDASKLHFSDSKAGFKHGYYGNNKNSANKAKVEVGGRFTVANIRFE